MALLTHIVKVLDNQFIELAAQGNLILLSVGSGDGELITASNLMQMRSAAMDRETAKVVGEKLISLSKRKVKP